MADLIGFSPAGRFAAGALLAVVVALAASRTGSLSRGGAAAAVLAGAAAAAAGWSWAVLLVTWFATTTALTHVGRAAKAARTGDVVAKGGRRDWRQVAANGGVFTVAALLWTLAPRQPVAALAAGSLAAAAADTWATEVGTLVRRPPWSILTFRPVPPGTSGGVTVAGSLAMLGGAGFVAVLVYMFGWGLPVAAAALVGGVAGAVADSLLGALVQARHWCPTCGRATEQLRHRCGTATIPAGGIRWIDNDVVNLLCALTGGLLAALVAA